MTDWDPELYLRFKTERTQPARDLLSRIVLENPRRVLDIGCGPGNSTALLADRWPDADITGLDNSAEMIVQARGDHPESQWPRLRWIVKDAGGDNTGLGTFDIVFSNAALQWMPDHDRLIPHLFSSLNTGGVFAVQVPNNSDSLMHAAVLITAKSRQWRNRLPGDPPQTYDSPEAYYRRLSLLSRRIDLWQTVYYHVMPSHQAILDWSRGTFMRPYLSRLDDEEKRKDFESDVLHALNDAYRPQENGKILFPFRRLFFIARK